MDEAALEFNGGALDSEPTNESFRGICNNEYYCFLCKYGGLDNEACLDENINKDVRALEAHLPRLRKLLGPKRAAAEMKVTYDEYIKERNILQDEPEWTEEEIYRHMVVHGVPESVQRGENTDDFAYEIFAGLLDYQKDNVINKETGLVDEKQLKHLTTIADRMYKFSSRGTKRKAPED